LAYRKPSGSTPAFGVAREQFEIELFGLSFSGGFQMLTATIPMSGPTGKDISTQNETIVSDSEISERVLRIRSGWSVAERVQRRREAERRFADLIDKLGAA
jgi:hypothetical protein